MSTKGIQLKHEVRLISILTLLFCSSCNFISQQNSSNNQQGLFSSISNTLASIISTTPSQSSSPSGTLSATTQTIYPATNFSFTLNESASTSAGVYLANGTLVRTLWGGVQYPAGTTEASWDGLDDLGNPVAPGNYTVKVLSDNVAYTWEGATIGNTSSVMSGATKIHAGTPMTGIAYSAGSNALYASLGYAEGWPSQFKIPASNPTTKSWFFPQAGTNQASMYVATDGKYVYYGGLDPFLQKNTFIFAVDSTANDAQVNFSPYGAPYNPADGQPWAFSYISTIAFDSNTNPISGLAVQKIGNYLFVTRQSLNQLQVYNKSTGQALQNFTIHGASVIAVDAADNLWIADSNGVEAYSFNAVNSNTIGATLMKTIPLSQFPSFTTGSTTYSSIGALAISPDGVTLAVLDLNAQIVRFFNTSTLLEGTSLGQAGGYFTSATVYNDKFYFRDINGPETVYLAYQPDGTLWVGDAGNYRAQHFSISNSGTNYTFTYINNIQYLPNDYNFHVNLTDPTRMIANGLEFKVDYSQPLTINNVPNPLAWKFVNNWCANVGAISLSNSLMDFVTLNNGRTYTFLGWYVMELVDGGIMRNTGIEKPNDFLPNGNLTQMGWNENQMVTYPLTGFDSNNNPIWGSATPYTGIFPQTLNDPQNIVQVGFISTPPMISSSGNAIIFDNSNQTCGQGCINVHTFHLGAVAPGSNQFLWKTARTTYPSYGGPFPSNGDFDIGNGVIYPGSVALVNGNNIVWGYHGENWKEGETNMWNHVDANTGLFIGQFGEANSIAYEDCPGCAGNVVSASIVNDPNDPNSLYVYHGEESPHSAVHRWKLSNLNSIQIQNISISLAAEANGLTGEYFTTSDFNSLFKKDIRTDLNLNFTWAKNDPDNLLTQNYSVRWTGLVKSDYAETYTFTVTTAGGVNLWINNQLIINQGANSVQGSYTGTIPLSIGWNSIRLEYSNVAANNSNIQLSYSSPSQTLKIIPNDHLQTNPDVVPLPNFKTGVDLLGGYESSYNFSIASTSSYYGWTIQGSEGDAYYAYEGDTWNAVVNSEKYLPSQTSNLYLAFNYPSSSSQTTPTTRSLTRYLGQTHLSAWSIKTNIENYTTSGTPGDFWFANLYLKVLDPSGNAIVSCIANGEYCNILCNGVSVYQLPYACNGYGNATDFLVQYQNGSLSVTASGVTTTIPNPASGTVLNSPNQLQFLGWGLNTINIQPTFDLQGLFFKGQ